MSRHGTPRPARWRARGFVRVRAILAGGLILGIGGSLTLASWVDTEYAQGSFSASRFDTESSVDTGTSWQDAVAAPGSVLAFQGTGMSPTAVRYASLWIRTKAASVAGTLSLQGATNTNATLAAVLLYRVVRYDTGTCGAALFIAGATYVVGSAGATEASKVALTTAGAATAVAANQTANTQLCFEVTMAAAAVSNNLLQGQSVVATWQVNAASNS
jgi:predicted ribosomally synthesized peptide with SipW-like signal peptide